MGGVKIYLKRAVEEKAFEEREKLVIQTNECLDNGQWKCAEKGISELLKQEPENENLKQHMAGILMEQGRYQDCIRWIERNNLNTSDAEFLKKKSEALIKEIEELGIEESKHFRLEFEGNVSRQDVAEALAVLEVAYDSLARLFNFYPENRFHLVLHQTTEFQGVGKRPEWAAAVFDGKLRVPTNLMQYSEIYRPIMFHELTHAFVRDIRWSNIPLWINEGIAQIIDGSNNTKPESSYIPSVNELTTPFVEQSNSTKATVLYWYSLQMVKEMLRINPSFSHLRQFIESLKKDATDESLKKFYGVTTQQLLNSVTQN
mgnify:CR=1 FL=1